MKAALIILVAIAVLANAQHPAGVASDDAKGNKTTYPFVTVMAPDNTRAYLLDVELADLYGVYFGDGDQIADPIVRNYGKTNSLPPCMPASVSAASVDERQNVAAFNWQHFNPNDPHHYVLANAAGTPMRIGTGHLRHSAIAIESYNGTFLVLRNPTTGARSLQHFRPFVNMRTGELMAESLRKNVYTQLANGTVTNTVALVSEDDEPGCFVSGSGEVTSVSIATYRCLSGECLKLSPLWTPLGEDEHDH